MVRKSKESSLLRRILFIAGLSYLGLVGVLFLLQRDLLYRPFGSYAPPQELGIAMQELHAPTADGQQALLWFSPPPEDASGKLVVFFHGNGGSLGHNRFLMEMLQQAQLGVLALEYRGYPGYAGRTTEQGIYADARAAMDFVQAQGYLPEDVILLGQSLGAAVAVQMATEYDTGLLALISPFTNIVDTAAEIYWYAPVRWLVWDRFDSYAKIADVQAPIYIFHGTEDGLVPYVQGQRLYEQAAGDKRFFALEGQGHNQLEYSRIIREIAHFTGAARIGEIPEDAPAPHEEPQT